MPECRAFHRMRASRLGPAYPLGASRIRAGTPSPIEMASDFFQKSEWCAAARAGSAALRLALDEKSVSVLSARRRQNPNQAAPEAEGSTARLLGIFGRKLETFLRVFAYFCRSCARIRRPRRTRTAAPATPAGVARYVLRSSAKPSHASGSATAHRMAIGRNAAPPNLA